VHTKTDSEEQAGQRAERLAENASELNARLLEIDWKKMSLLLIIALEAAQGEQNPARIEFTFCPLTEIKRTFWKTLHLKGKTDKGTSVDQEYKQVAQIRWNEVPNE